MPKRSRTELEPTTAPELEFRPEYGKTFSDGDVVSLFWQNLFDSKAGTKEWRSEAKVLLDMYRSKTLSSEDLVYLQRQKRAPIEANFAIGTVNAILGTVIADRREVVFKGEDMGQADQVLAEWDTRLVRRIFVRGGGHRRLDATLSDVLCTGMGWASVYLDTTRVPVEPAIEGLDLWEMWSDPHAKKPGLADMTFAIRERLWEIEEVQARWPDRAEQLIALVHGGTINPVQPQRSVQGSWTPAKGPIGRQRIHIYQHQYVRYVPRVWYQHPDGDELDVTPEEFARAQRELRAGTGELAHHRYSARQAFSAYIAGDAGSGGALLLENKELGGIGEEPTLMCCTGYPGKDFDTGQVRYFGPLRVMHDAQMYLNRSMLVITDTLSRTSKGGGGFIEKSALLPGVSIERFADYSAVPGGWVVVNNGAVVNGKIFERQAQPMPAGYEALVELCVELIHQLTGVTEAMRGTLERERSNVLISNLQGQSMTLLNPLLDPFSEFLVRMGTRLAQLIHAHASDDWINAVLGDVRVDGLTHHENKDAEDDAERWQPILIDGTEEPVTPAYLLRESDPLRYDIVADTGIASPTHRQAVWQIFVQTNLLGMMIERGIPIEPILPDLVEFLPMPSDLAKKLADKLRAFQVSQEKLRTQEGILETLANMPPEERQKVLMGAFQQFQGEVAQMPEGGGEGGPPIPPPVERETAA